jgi:leucyl aminopeptidase
MKVILKKGIATSLSTLVVFGAKNKKTGKAMFTKLSADLLTLAEFAERESGFTGDKKEACFFRRANTDGYTNVLLVGIGDSSMLESESLRVAAATAYGSLVAHKIKSVGVLGDSALKFFEDSAGAIQTLSEGFGLCDYDYSDLKSTSKKEGKSDDKPRLKEISILLSSTPSTAQLKAVERAEILSECQNFARWLGDHPGNYLTPTMLADETVKAAKGTKLKVTAWDLARIKKERFGGLLSVSQGSAQEPRFIIMEYNGAGKGKKAIALVGKGLTFDSGGISIKPSAQMEEMKYDMCGAATVIGTMLALAKLKAKVNVIAYVPSSENLPGPAALKPGDVYFARNGKSVEVFNTDAEGRLILGDALAYASENKPVAIFNVATLTGAIVVALGNTHTGVFTRDSRLMDKIRGASDNTGELVWHMPLTDFHVEDIKGTHADICNISPGRMAGSSTAAAFLEQMVGTGIPFAHFDIAGTAWNVGGRAPYHPKKGASGVLVRTFVDLIENF